MSVAQVQAFSAGQVAALTTSQIQSLTSAQIAGLDTDQVQALTTTQVAAIRSSGLSQMTTGQIVALTTAQVRALTTAQIVALTSTQIAKMETEDVAALTTDQIAAMQVGDLASMTTGQIEALTTAQVQALTTSQILGMTTAQIEAIETADIEALTSSQFAAMSTTQFAAFKTAQIAAIEVADIPALTTAQLSNLSMAQHGAFTGAQLAAMSGAQTAALALSTPLVLDLDGNGVQTLGLSSNVRFDLNATGTALNTGWVGQGDGLLAIDINGDGQVNDGSELFGSSYTLADGTRAQDGFAALASLDSDHNGVIDANDQQYASLLVWKDANQDGISQGDELFSLSSLDITSINTGATQTTELNNGNWIGLSASYATGDGTTHTIADVWFQTDAGLSQSVDSLVSAMASFAPAPAASVEAQALDQQQTCPIMLAVPK